jgi:transposase-like protein
MEIQLQASRQRYSAEFKAAIAFEAVRGTRSPREIAEQHSIDPRQVNLWKKQLMAGAISLFQDKRLGPQSEKPRAHARSERIYREIGELAVELARGRVRRLRALQR